MQQSFVFVASTTQIGTERARLHFAPEYSTLNFVFNLLPKDQLSPEIQRFAELEEMWRQCLSNLGFGIHSEPF